MGFNYCNGRVFCLCHSLFWQYSCSFLTELWFLFFSRKVIVVYLCRNKMCFFFKNNVLTSQGKKKKTNISSKCHDDFVLLLFWSLVSLLNICDLVCYFAFFFVCFFLIIVLTAIVDILIVKCSVLKFIKWFYNFIWFPAVETSGEKEKNRDNNSRF